jgi:SAM-dependent methyltransferase
MVSLDHDNWDRHWEEYNQAAEESPAQSYRRTVIFSLLEIRDSGKGVRLLDIGSGQGDMAAAVRTRFPSAEILGLELSQSGVEISRRKVPGARFVQRNLLETLTPPDDQRDWATHAVCSEVIEHVDNPITFVQSLRNYLKPGGRLIVTVPGGPMSSFDRHIGHRKHFDANSITTVLKSAGFSVEKIQLAGFPFFNLYRLTVILRGGKLIEDVKAGTSHGRPNALAILAMRVFGFLFHWNADDSRFGWQIVALARKLEP